MDKLDLNIITRFKLNKLDSVDHVRRRNNSYSVNEEGKLVALSLSESYLQKLIIGEEGFHLEHLYLAGNQELTHVEFTGSFPNLVHLYLNNCKLNRIIIPAGLSSLRQAYFQNNQLIELTFEGDCPELQFLDLSKNQMQRFSLPSGFSRLAYLYLSDNRLKELIFDTLSGLEILHLKGNQLDELPTNFLALSKLETLYLSGNPLSNIPPDVIGSGDMHNSASTVLAYLKSIRGKITQYLHEAKLILIGNPEVGKSSIRIKLQDPTADLPTQDERTPGLIVERYFLNQLPVQLTNLENPIDYQLNIWDFGGQGRYREIQQLFCSRKSLYLFVTSYDDTPVKEDYIGLEYWLSMVNAYSYDQEQNRPSPVIYVLNKIDCKDEGIDEVQSRKAFSNLTKFVKISCTEYLNFDVLIGYLREVLPSVSKDIFSNAYSQEWFRVKEQLEKKAEHNNHIDYVDYWGICKAEGLDEEQAKAWLTILDRIGSVIYFGDNKDLNNWIVLNPIWVKDAICNVIDNPLVTDEGILKEEFFDAIWKQYPEKLERRNLVKLMLAYKLAYPIKLKGKEVYVVPSALFNRPKPTIEDYPHLQQKANLQFEFHFDPFIPAGIVNKLMVSLNRNIYNNLIWGNGCILHEPVSNTFVELREDWSKRTIQVDIFGNDAQAFYEIIAVTLNVVTEEIKSTRFLQHLTFTEWMFYKDKFHKRKDLEDFGVYPWSKLEVKTDGHKPKPNSMHGIEKEIKGLSDALDLIIDKKNYFETEFQKTYDADKKYTLKLQIKDLETDIEAYRTKIRGKEQSIHGFENYEGSKAKLDVLLEKAEQISQDISRMETKLDAGFDAVLTQLSAQDQQLIAILDTSQSTRTELAQYFHDLDQKPTNEYELEIIIQRINSMIGEHFSNLPEELAQKLKLLNSKSADYTDVKGKFKLKIPIIPAILEYEKEVNWDLRNVAKQIWTDLKAGKIFLK